ncbi:MAG: copper amine oxidase N-terminal domain-containing protein [Clostridia bacterium]|nr:copper amine oxidase N-terminal domain-containing protein [Clostridia bacterium]
MKKRIIVTLIAVSLCVSSTSAFAANDMHGVGMNMQGIGFGGMQQNSIKQPMQGMGSSTTLETLGNVLNVDIDYDEDAGSITIASDDVTIEMTVGSTSATVDDEDATLPFAPTTSDDDVLIPLDFILESLGLTADDNGRINVDTLEDLLDADVEYDEDDDTITIESDDVTIVMTIDSTTATVDDEEVTIKVAPIIDDDDVLVPLNFVLESLGLVSQKQNMMQDGKQIGNEPGNNSSDTSKDKLQTLKESFKNADSSTKKELLNQIAQAKKDVGDSSIGVFVKGSAVNFENYDNVTPIIKDGRTLIPVRAIAESLGAEVNYDSDTGTITIVLDGKEVTLKINDTSATVDGKQTTLEVAPMIDNGRTFVPVRFISEAFGLDVEWDSDSQTVIIDDAE